MSRRSCSHIADCAALHEIATTRQNRLKQAFIDQLRAGLIGVPSRVLQEFRELYEDEAAALEPDIAVKIDLNVVYLQAAARLAQKRNSGFSRRPYDRDADLYAAAIADVEEYTVLTTKKQRIEYHGIGCQVVDLVTWIGDIGEGGGTAA